MMYVTQKSLQFVANDRTGGFGIRKTHIHLNLVEDHACSNIEGICNVACTSKTCVLHEYIYTHFARHTY
jgi:hypothetical protein